MKRTLSLVLMTITLLAGTGVLACEKHLDGHQRSSDTSSEASGK
jgi:hypothetical protein